MFDSVYDEFRERFVAGARSYETGPVISEASLERILGSARAARTSWRGGERLDRPGWWLAPTVVEDVSADAELSCTELFGPVAILYRVRDLEEAIALVNDSPYGLTSAIHTASLHRAMRFADEVEAGVVVVNGGTHGSEPHMGFGGVKQSGTGWREAGVEALDVYTEWKYVNLIADPGRDVSGRVAILGPGAVGGVLAVGLERAGVSVVCVARPGTAALITSDGPDPEHGEEDETSRPEVDDRAARAGRPPARHREGACARRCARPHRRRQPTRSFRC